MGLRNEPCFCHFNGFQVKDAIGRISAGETEFKASSILKGLEYGLDLFTVEYFDAPDQIDETKVDGNYVIENFYDADKHEINIPTNVNVSIQSKSINTDFNTKAIYVHGDYEGEGSVLFQFSTNGGSSFENITEDTLTQNNNNGRNLVMKLTLIGPITFKNIGWGVSR